jgi:thiol:disulfide interchange protein DsbA
MKLRWLLITMSLLCAPPALADKQFFFQGINYEPVTLAQPTSVKPGQVEVIEFYWYGCPHCFAVEPYLLAWEKQLPKDVVFKRVPAAIQGSQFYLDAQAAVVADQLGLGDKIREPFFNAIHQDGNLALRNDKGAIRDFFGKFGIKPADFDAAWDSPAVKAQLDADERLIFRYQTDQVPTIIVNGKWKTGTGYQMAPPDIIKCVQYLIDKEQTPAK